MMKRIAYFLHLPKCCGRYIRYRLGNNRGGNNEQFFNSRHSYFEEEQVDPKGDFERRAVPAKEIYFIFTVVRNPFDLLVSYFYSYRAGMHGWGNVNAIHGLWTFEDFIARFVDLTKDWHEPALRAKLDFQLYFRGELLPEVVLRKENVVEDLEKMAADNKLTMKKFEKRQIRGVVCASPRRQYQDYRKYYTDDMVALVTPFVAGYCARWGYSFEH